MHFCLIKDYFIDLRMDKKKGESIMDFIVEFAKTNSALFAGITTFLIAVLSNALAILEYFKKKAYCDYFFIEDYARNGYRSGFHPEYLSSAVLIFCVTIGIYMLIHSFFGEINIYMTSILIIVSPSVISFFASIFIFAFYHSAERNDMKCWDKAELIQTNLLVAKKNFLKWLAVSIVFALANFLYTLSGEILIIVISVPICIYVYIKFEYEYTKKLLKRTIKFFSIIEDRQCSYAILNTNNDIHYCVEIKIINMTACLLLDHIKIYTVSDPNIVKKRKYIKKFERILNQ